MFYKVCLVSKKPRVQIPWCHKKENTALQTNSNALLNLQCLVIVLLVEVLL
jgi:hypothetical protein